MSGTNLTANRRIFCRPALNQAFSLLFKNHKTLFKFCLKDLCIIFNVKTTLYTNHSFHKNMLSYGLTSFVYIFEKLNESERNVLDRKNTKPRYLKHVTICKKRRSMKLCLDREKYYFGKHYIMNSYLNYSKISFITYGSGAEFTNDLMPN